MKIFLSCDIEGTSGIIAWDETEYGESRYKYFQEQMTREAVAACKGAISAGAEKVLLRDAHDSARNIIPWELPEEVMINRGWMGDPYSMMSGIDTDTFDAAMMTGYHSGASYDGNPLSHTMTTKVAAVMLNGDVMSEFKINAMSAGYLGIPVPFLSGDAQLCKTAEEWIPGITTVPTNYGTGRGSISISPKKAVRLIEEGVKKALDGDYAKCAVPLPDTFKTEVIFKNHTDCYSLSFYPKAVRKDSRTISFKTNDYFELLRFYHFVI